MDMQRRRMGLITPIKRQEQQHNARLAALQAAAAALLPGASMAAPTEAATRALREEGQVRLHPDRLESLPPSDSADT
ncbi:MAG: hypothetical protein WDW36_009717 [Sanguina aurantia]